MNCGQYSLLISFPSHFHLLAGSEEVAVNKTMTQPYKGDNPAEELLDGVIIQSGSNKQIDTTKNTRRNEGINVIVKVSPISPKLTFWPLQPIEMWKILH